MQGKNYQRGVSGLGWLGVIILIIFVGYLGLRLVPPYYSHYIIVNTLKKTLNSQHITMGNFQRFQQDFNREFENRLSINDILDVKADNITISEENNAIYVNLNYQTQVHVIGNMDVLLRFHNKLKAISE